MVQRQRWQEARVRRIIGAQGNPMCRSICTLLLIASLSLVASDKGPHDDVVITLERTTCFGTCPAYKLTIHGDGEQTRDFTHVRDVVSANILAMDAAGAKGVALNIGQGRNVSINWIADKIGGPKVNLPARRGDARDTLADNLRAQEVLGWRPQVTTEEGLIDLVKASGL